MAQLPDYLDRETVLKLIAEARADERARMEVHVRALVQRGEAILAKLRRDVAAAGKRAEAAEQERDSASAAAKAAKSNEDTALLALARAQKR